MSQRGGGQGPPLYAYVHQNAKLSLLLEGGGGEIVKAIKMRQNFTSFENAPNEITTINVKYVYGL